MDIKEKEEGDWVKYQLWKGQDWNSEDEAQLALKDYMCFVKQYVQDNNYIWQKDQFYLEVAVTPSAGGKCLFSYSRNPN
jgi:hypothetical protein